MIWSNPPHQRTEKKYLVRRNDLVTPHIYINIHIYVIGKVNSKERKIKGRKSSKERKENLTFDRTRSTD
jgi:hypothetical protein